MKDAGHMVPMDQPKAALNMLKSWMKNSLREVPVDVSAEGEELVAQM